MTDINPIHIPPVGPPGESKAGRSAPAGGGGPADFKETLKKTLGEVSSEAERVAQTPPGVHEVDQAMSTAKNLFAETMQAHQMMRHLLGEPPAPDGGGEDSNG